MPFKLIGGRVSMPRGFGMTLHSLWSSSNFTWFNSLTPWPASGLFDEWWAKARSDCGNARATSFYRYGKSLWPVKEPAFGVRAERF